MALVLCQTHQWTLKLIGKASGTFARLSGRVWDNPKLTTRTKSAVYRACVCSTLLCGSETWTLSTMQEKKINTFRQRCLRRILRIKRQHKIISEEVLRRSGLTTLSKASLAWSCSENERRAHPKGYVIQHCCYLATCVWPNSLFS